MKTQILACIIVLLALPVTGCALDSITPDQAKALGEKVEVLSNQIPVYQKAVNDIAKNLQDAGMLSDSDATKLAELNNKINEVVPKIVDAAKAIQTGQYSEDSKGLVTVLEGLKAANRATSPWNQYVIPIDLVLSSVIAILGLIAKKESDKRKIATSTLRTIVKVIEASDETVAVPIKEKMSFANTTKGKALINQVKTS